MVDEDMISLRQGIEDASDTLEDLLLRPVIGIGELEELKRKVMSLQRQVRSLREEIAHHTAYDSADHQCGETTDHCELELVGDDRAADL
jgi:Mg2+ and Co2+ transporter CorA